MRSTRLKKAPKIARNSPCPCNSGKKYKKCCFIKAEVEIEQQLEMRRSLENAYKQESKSENEKKEVVQESIEGTKPDEGRVEEQKSVSD